MVSELTTRIGAECVLALIILSGCAAQRVLSDPNVLRMSTSEPRAEFETWRADYSQRLKRGSRVIETRLGAIEFADIGEGVAYLALHGTPGGYDASLAGYIANPAQSGIRTVAVSRPGYLRTPLSSGPTFEQQADLFESLLDKLKIGRVVVIAASGGSYAGLQFALRHPDRCIALVLLAPAIGSEPLPKNAQQTEAQLEQQDRALWGMTEAMYPAIMKGFDSSDATQKAFLSAILMSRVPAGSRVAGRLNDLTQRSYPSVDLWPLERIVVPTLIIHGTKDENSNYSLSEKAASRIPKGKLVTLDGADHFMPITHANKVQSEIAAFVAAEM